MFYLFQNRHRHRLYIWFVQIYQNIQKPKIQVTFGQDFVPIFVKQGCRRKQTSSSHNRNFHFAKIRRIYPIPYIGGFHFRLYS